jgi:hypothetical protein
MEILLSLVFILVCAIGFAGILYFGTACITSDYKPYLWLIISIFVCAGGLYGITKWYPESETQTKCACECCDK